MDCRLQPTVRLQSNPHVKLTASALAEMLHARSAGVGRWMALCPAHDDHSPSLSIREAEDGRTLVLCRAGCRTGDVVRAAGLRWRDLYAGPPPSPAESARLAHEREARAEAGRKVRLRARRWREELVWTIEACKRNIDAIAPGLMTMPDGPEAGRLTDTLHQLYAVLHRCESLQARQ